MLGAVQGYSILELAHQHVNLGHPSSWTVPAARLSQLLGRIGKRPLITVVEGIKLRIEREKLFLDLIDLAC